MKRLYSVYPARHGVSVPNLIGRHTSPLQRARRTSESAGYGAKAEVDRDLPEWNYGEYEGCGTSKTGATRPDWQLIRERCAGGESLAQVDALAISVLKRVRAHWLGMSLAAGGFLASTGGLSALGIKHNPQPLILLWNDTGHCGYLRPIRPSYTSLLYKEITTWPQKL